MIDNDELQSITAEIDQLLADPANRARLEMIHALVMEDPQLLANPVIAHLNRRLIGDPLDAIEQQQDASPLHGGKIRRAKT